MWLPSLFAAGSCYHPIIDRGGGRGTQNTSGVPSPGAVVGMWAHAFTYFKAFSFSVSVSAFSIFSCTFLVPDFEDLESNAKTRRCGRQFNCDVRRCVRPLDNDWFRICPRLFSHGWEILNRVCNIGSGRGSVLPLLRHRHRDITTGAAGRRRSSARQGCSLELQTIHRLSQSRRRPLLGPSPCWSSSPVSVV